MNEKELHQIFFVSNPVGNAEVGFSEVGLTEVQLDVIF